VFEIYESVKIPVIGVGGITTSRDALEYIMAGASAVQVGTAVWTNGIGVFRQICDGLSEFMEEYGYKSVASMVGVAHSARH
jgi:dihydroorotate dehydrogenase (NAD+) catalytic subunit